MYSPFSEGEKAGKSSTSPLERRIEDKDALTFYRHTRKGRWPGMAQGLSIPALSPDLGSSLQGLWNRLLQQDRENVSTPTSSANSPQTVLSEDLLDLGQGQQLPVAAPPPGGMTIAPDGTYQFSRSSFSASLDFSMNETQVTTTQGADGSQTFASMRDLRMSIQVSAEFEQALIETGRSRGGNPQVNFGDAARQAVERFKAQQIRASISVNISFSQTSIAFDNTGAIQGDLEALSLDGSLGGFATLLETFFGDDERFAAFLQKLNEFLQGVQGGSAPGSAPQAAPQEGDPAPQQSGGPQSFSVQSQSIQVSMNLSFESTRIEMRSKEAPPADPVVLDLDGDGVELTSAAEGVDFDLDADGQTEKMATVKGGDGFLVLDRNGNGKIDSGKELFGDQHGAANGFEELARFDSNQDGRIDRDDAVFNQLRVLVSQAAAQSVTKMKMLSLDQLGIRSINLAARDVSQAAMGGNRLAQISHFTRHDGSQGQAADVLLNRLV